KSMPLERAAAEHAKKKADEDLKYFLEVGRGESEKSAHFMVKTAKFYLEYAQEELRQLQKMYKANDLTEETEKIILRRQENYVEMEAFFYQRMLIYRDEVLKFTLPNRDKALRESQARATLQLEKARTTLAPTLHQKQQALAQMRYNRDK